jgi:hypothetical protein
MYWDDYLRGQATHYRQLAEAAEDPLIKQEHFELAAVCEKVAKSYRGSPNGRLRDRIILAGGFDPQHVKHARIRDRFKPRGTKP